MALPEAVLFDVDFTLCKPGPLLGPERYRDAGRRYGLTLEPDLYEQARAAAFEDLRHHPELDHDEEVWIRFTEDIVQGMGGTGPAARSVAVEITRAWEQHENFELYDDSLPVLRAVKAAGLKIALVSNTSRDLNDFVRYHAIAVDAAVTSRTHGKVKPHPTIFHAALSLLRLEPQAAVMVGDSLADDIEGARAVGIRAVLVDRARMYPDEVGRLETLAELPQYLGLPGGSSRIAPQPSRLP